MIKDCLIIAAGNGTRIKALGGLKPLVDLGGTPLIEHAMAAAAKSGVERFLVVTGYNAALLESFLVSLGNKRGWKISTVHNPDFDQANGLSVLQSESHLDDAFFLAMCDHVVSPTLYEALLAADLPTGAVGLGVDLNLANPNVDLDDVTKVKLIGGKIQHIGKELTDYNAFDTGIFRANPELFSAIRESQRSTGDCSLSGGMKELARRGLAIGVDIGASLWIDVDSQAMHERASDILQTS